MLDRENPGADEQQQVSNLESGQMDEQQRSMAEPQRPKRGRGFASMDPEKQREIASKGGKAAHAKGTAHEFSSEEAREAGCKGGQARGRKAS